MVATRRHAIKQLLMVSAGIALLPSCMQDKEKSSILLKKMSVDAGQEKLLAELCETIIPATETPGAKDISAHLFALKMMDDCFSNEDQQKFVAGMKSVEEMSQKQSGKSFVNSTPDQRQAVVKSMEARKNDKDDLAYFYGTLKRLTIQAYTTSKYYLTKVQVYELIPSRYHGCVRVGASA